MDYSSVYLSDLARVLGALDVGQIQRVRDRISALRERGGTLFLCGNGGSAATATHMANDLGKGASLAATRRFRVVALTDNAPWITALANDVSYDVVFAEQLRNLGSPGDGLLAISGSGNSPNVLNAVEVAKEVGMETYAFTGFGGGRLAPACDLAIVADSDHRGRMEDAHTVLMHVMCYYFMEAAT